MTKVFIIHGSYGNPGENWFPWLKKELEGEGHNVFIPKFPTPADQSLDSWMNVLEPYFKEIDEDTIFVGHSLAPAFILSILEKINVKIKACFFVSGFLGLLGNEDFDKINKTFVTKDFDWNKIKENCAKFFMFHSDKDPYVPLEKAEELKEKLGAELIIIKNAGHFNTEAGYTQFEQLLEKIKQQL